MSRAEHERRRDYRKKRMIFYEILSVATPARALDIKLNISRVIERSCNRIRVPNDTLYMNYVWFGKERTRRQNDINDSFHIHQKPNEDEKDVLRVGVCVCVVNSAVRDIKRTCLNLDMPHVWAHWAEEKLLQIVILSNLNCSKIGGAEADRGPCKLKLSVLWNATALYHLTRLLTLK